ncbi:MAG: hypothetical protein A2161_09200, partial [Candidatus Schekmanbacteria bacterium RBG_13_48_7]
MDSLQCSVCRPIQPVLRGFPAIGMVEFTSIAVGIHTCDTMLKKAPVYIVDAGPVCPGKYLVLITGDEESVKESVNVGVKTGDDTVVDFLIIPNVHHQVVPAVRGMTDVKQIKSIGVIETFTVASTITSADAAAKAAHVDLIELRLARGIAGKGYFVLTGELFEVEAAVEAGSGVIEKLGILARKRII